MNKWKKFVKSLIPPFIIEKILKIHAVNEYTGDYKSFKEARLHSSGYDQESVFEKVKQSRLKVLNNEAKYERDGVVFNKIQFFWPVIAGLLYVSSKNNNE